MPALDDAFKHLPNQGRVGLLDLITAKNPEAGLATEAVTTRAASQHRGGVEWAGHVDQVFFGDVSDAPNEVLIHTYPSKKDAIDALAARREWGLDALVDRVRTLAFRPAPAFERVAARAFFRLFALRGRRTPIADLSDPSRLEAAVLVDGDPSLRPSREAVEAYAASGIEGKVIMLNLLQYRRDAQGNMRAGREAYGRYGRVVTRMIAGLGGRLRSRGTRLSPDDGTPAQSWDELACVEYPSRADFVGMATSDAYAAAAVDRDEALDRSALLVCTSHAKYF